MKKQTTENSEKTDERLTKSLGLKNLRVTEQMHKDISDSACEDERAIQDEVRYLLKLGLLKREEQKK